MSTHDATTAERARLVVAEMAPRPLDPTGFDAALREDLGYDSLSLLELAAALEDEFGLPASAELDAAVAETVADVAQTVADALHEAAA